MLPRNAARSAWLKTSAVSCGRFLNFPTKLCFRLNYLFPQFDPLHSLKPDAHFSHVKKSRFLPLREHISPRESHERNRNNVVKRRGCYLHLSFEGLNKLHLFTAIFSCSVKVMYFSFHADWHFKTRESNLLFFILGSGKLPSNYLKHFYTNAWVFTMLPMLNVQKVTIRCKQV